MMSCFDAALIGDDVKAVGAGGETADLPWFAVAGVPPRAEAAVPPAAAVVSAPGVENERGVHDLREEPVISHMISSCAVLVSSTRQFPLAG